MNGVTPPSLLSGRSAGKGSDESEEDVVSFCISDTILTLCVALLIFVPNAGKALAVRQPTQSVSSAKTDSVAPIRVRLEPGKIEAIIDGSVYQLDPLPDGVEKRIHGAHANIEIHKRDITADEMTAITLFYARNGLESWSFEFQP